MIWIVAKLSLWYDSRHAPGVSVCLVFSLRIAMSNAALVPSQMQRVAMEGKGKKTTDNTEAGLYRSA